MESAARKLSAMIATQMHYDDNKKAVIAYGLTALFQLICIGLIISLLGILADTLYESLVIFCGVAILKKSTGGAHAKSINACTMISISSIFIMSFVSRYVFCFTLDIYINILVSIVVFVVCSYVFYKYVPVDSPNKPISKPEKIRRLRLQSFVLLSIYSLLAIIVLVLAPGNIRLVSISNSVRFCILWQSIMVSKIGARLISFNKKYKEASS